MFTPFKASKTECTGLLQLNRHNEYNIFMCCVILYTIDMDFEYIQTSFMEHKHTRTHIHIWELYRQIASRFNQIEKQFDSLSK